MLTTLFFSHLLHCIAVYAKHFFSLNTTGGQKLRSLYCINQTPLSSFYQKWSTIETYKHIRNLTNNKTKSIKYLRCIEQFKKDYYQKCYIRSVCIQIYCFPSFHSNYSMRSSAILTAHLVINYEWFVYILFYIMYIQVFMLCKQVQIMGENILLRCGCSVILHMVWTILGGSVFGQMLHNLWLKATYQLK